jgi:ketosteroid isomerase-like protein
MEVGRAIVDCCARGAYLEAVDSYYADDIVSVEPGESETRGKATVREKTVAWIEMHEVHESSFLGPFPNGDRFAMHLKVDMTPRSGPMSGQRITMEEVCLYTVKGGKIVHEEFFYSMG